MLLDGFRWGVFGSFRMSIKIKGVYFWVIFKNKHCDDSKAMFTP